MTGSRWLAKTALVAVSAALMLYQPLFFNLIGTAESGWNFPMQYDIAQNPNSFVLWLAATAGFVLAVMAASKLTQHIGKATGAIGGAIVGTAIMTAMFAAGGVLAYADLQAVRDVFTNPAYLGPTLGGAFLTALITATLGTVFSRTIVGSPPANGGLPTGRTTEAARTAERDGENGLMQMARTEA